MSDRWWKIQEPNDAKPFAVAFIGADGLIRRFVPDEGLVDWPPLAMWFFGEEMGLTEITRGDADRLMEAGIGRLPEGLDTVSSRGSAPTVPVPAP